MEPKEFMRQLAAENDITATGFLPLSACRVIPARAYLLERAGIFTGSVMMMAVPYYTHACDGPRNLSAYAVGRDYHLFFRELWEKMIPRLEDAFPGNRFAGFADHSPIDEVSAAAAAGLGVIGQNGLLLTERWSSFVFLGTLVTDVQIDCTPKPVRYCENCGACAHACPVSLPKPRGTVCLSALTQKKGALTADEKNALRDSGSVWGCDACQEACPYTKKAKKDGTIYTNIHFFEENTIPVLTAEKLGQMSEAEFSERAYAWRGRAVIERNLKETEETEC